MTGHDYMDNAELRWSDDPEHAMHTGRVLRCTNGPDSNPVVMPVFGPWPDRCRICGSELSRDQ